MSTVVDGLVSFSKEVSYKLIHRPIWRGISSQYVNFDDYKPNTIGIWPSFTSCTSEHQMAYDFSIGKSNGKDPLVFKIYLTRNDPETSI